MRMDSRPYLPVPGVAALEEEDVMKNFFRGVVILVLTLAFAWLEVRLYLTYTFWRYAFAFVGQSCFIVIVIAILAWLIIDDDEPEKE